jgi:hypothetical protein
MANPIDRRTALGSIAAAGAMLSVPRVSKAASAEDAELFAALNRLGDLRKAQQAADERHSALERLCPGPKSVPALIAKAGDQSILRVPVDDPPIVEGEPLNCFHVHAGQKLLRVFRLCGVENSDPLFGGAYTRAAEICDAWDRWRVFRDAEYERLGVNEAQDAFDEAVSATHAAAAGLLDFRPQTIAGLRAMVRALVDLNVFECQEEGEALASLLLEAPALAGEA